MFVRTVTVLLAIGLATNVLAARTGVARHERLKVRADVKPEIRAALAAQGASVTAR